MADDLASLSNGIDLPLSVPKEVSQSVYTKACSLYKVVQSPFVLSHLTSIDLPLQDRAIGPLGAKAIATALVTNTTVKSLNVCNTGIGTQGLGYILQMIEGNATITNLNLSYNELRSEGAKALAAAFVDDEHIRVLNISGNEFNDDDSLVLSELIEENVFLREFIVSRNGFADAAGLAFGRALSNNSTLTHFDVSWNHLRQRGAIDLCTGLQDNSSVHTLNLSWNGFGMEGCHAMGKLLQSNKTITDLDLTSNRVNYDAFKLLLRGIVRNKNLEVLKIGVNPITTDGATAILRSVADDKCASIHELDLSDICVDLDFVSLLRQIQQKRPLVVKYGITLRHDEIRKGNKPVVLDTDDPVTIFFECMKTKNMRLIDLLHSLDKDNSETLSREELRKGLEDIDIPLSQRSMDILMQRLDINRDGHVDFGELLTKYKEHLRRVTKLRQEADIDLRHFKNYNKLEQLREVVRFRLKMSSTGNQ